MTDITETQPAAAEVKKGVSANMQAAASMNTTT